MTKRINWTISVYSVFLILTFLQYGTISLLLRSENNSILCAIFSCIFCSMFLIETINPNVKKEIKVLIQNLFYLFARLLAKGGMLGSEQNKTSFVWNCLFFYFSCFFLLAASKTLFKRYEKKYFRIYKFSLRGTPLLQISLYRYCFFPLCRPESTRQT